MIVVYCGKIRQKSYKEYLVNGVRKPALVLDFGIKGR